MFLSRNLSSPRRSAAAKFLLPVLQTPPFPPSPSPSPSPSSSSPPLPLKPSQNPNPPTRPFSSLPRSQTLTLPPLSSSSSSSSLPLCPGCGVHMQSSDPSIPGFFSPPSPKTPDYRASLDRSHSISLSSLPLSLKSGHLSNPNPNPDPDPDPDQDEGSKPEPVVVCARCHSLRHYGRVKNPAAENLLPDFDFDRTVAPKILSPCGTRSVVLTVVDASDFDGSFPKRLARSLSSSIDKHSRAWKENKPGNVPRVLLVVTKCDVLSPSLSPQRLEEWVRRRVHECGSLRLTGVHLVSSVKEWGVRNLVEHVRELVGEKGNVWAVGAQNAGKSTLINAMGRCGFGGGRKMDILTEAPVPGTTLGIVRVEGVLSGQAKLFDTPGLLQPNQMTVRLTREEQKLVHIGKELRPRTYRIKSGYSVHLGGLMRVDLEDSSAESIYLTVWASHLLPLHMGRTENTSKMIEHHFGRQLQPPISENRVAELGQWTRTEFKVSGTSWDMSSIDIAVAGLGWVAVGLKGEVTLGVWTYDGVEVVSRSSLISERARLFEQAGFTVSKIVSKADSKSNKLKHEKKEKKQHEGKVKQPSSSSIEPSIEADMTV